MIDYKDYYSIVLDISQLFIGGEVMKNNLNAILKERGISQLELSRNTRISPSDINQVINGKKYCFPGWKKRIADFLEIEEETIFEE